MKNDYYVYAYLDPRKSGIYIYDDLEFNFKPFYIGKGKGKRIFNGLDDPNNTNSKKSKINEIREIGFEPICIKIYDKLTENIAYNLEKKLIKSIGTEKDYGILTNKSKGCSASKVKINLYNLKTDKNLLVNVIGTSSDFFYLNEGNYIHKELFLKIFEKYD